MRLNDALFRDNGGCGYVLKPRHLRHDAAPAEERVVAVFSHGIAIRCFVRGLFGAEANFVVSSLTANTSITELRYRPRPLDNMGGWQLVRMNDAAHLHELDAA